MTDFQIYKKLRPFILNRVAYALLGLLVILVALALITDWVGKYPEYRTFIIVFYSVLGVFIGWKIIRKGEKVYLLEQIALISELVTGKKPEEVNRKTAEQMVKKTFKYFSLPSLARNILRHRNLLKAGQFFTVNVLCLIPYMGPCITAWLFTHPEEHHFPGVCHGIQNYLDHRKEMRSKVGKAVLLEIIFVCLVFIILMALETAIYEFIVNCFPGLIDLIPRIAGFGDTLSTVWEMYFVSGSRNYSWSLTNVMIVTALYLAWFIKVFSLRAYQMIGILRTYLKLGEQDPPGDRLYRMLTKGKTAD